MNSRQVMSEQADASPDPDGAFPGAHCGPLGSAAGLLCMEVKYSVTGSFLHCGIL